MDELLEIRTEIRSINLRMLFCKKYLEVIYITYSYELFKDDETLLNRY